MLQSRYKTLSQRTFPEEISYSWKDIGECFIFPNEKWEESFAILIDQEAEFLILNHIIRISQILHNNKGFYRKAFYTENIKPNEKGYKKYHSFNMYSDDGDISLILLNHSDEDYNTLEELFFFLSKTNENFFKENDETPEV